MMSASSSEVGQSLISQGQMSYTSPGFSLPSTGIFGRGLTGKWYGCKGFEVTVGVLYMIVDTVLDNIRVNLKVILQVYSVTIPYHLGLSTMCMSRPLEKLRMIYVTT